MSKEPEFYAVCPFCNEDFADEEAFFDHILTHRNDPRPRGKCPGCGAEVHVKDGFCGNCEP